MARYRVGDLVQNIQDYSLYEITNVFLERGEYELKYVSGNYITLSFTTVEEPLIFAPEPCYKNWNKQHDIQV